MASTYLREEGMLAAQLGDYPGATRAYDHYLALHSHPETKVRASADSIHSEVKRLRRMH